MASASAVSQALSMRATDSFSAWLWMRMGRFKGRTCGTLRKKFETKTRRRMARERRGAGSSLVSMETPYYKTIY